MEIMFLWVYLSQRESSKTFEKLPASVKIQEAGILIFQTNMDTSWRDKIF